MSADPALPPTTPDLSFLEALPPLAALPADAGELEALQTEASALRMQLETERSAGKALVAALTELEARLASEREKVAFQRDQNSQLWGEIECVNNELSMELAKPAWRRLLGR
jgi:chromosome segregation ATPase